MFCRQILDRQNTLNTRVCMWININTESKAGANKCALLDITICTLTFRSAFLVGPRHPVTVKNYATLFLSHSFSSLFSFPSGLFLPLRQVVRGEERAVVSLLLLLLSRFDQQRGRLSGPSNSDGQASRADTRSL